ncbi:hypothetical protein [Flavobacterium sp.]|uniref:hypothetical protein n=1 Tax=Flavobacterium sp. TaxID=239 RepID=UPI00248A2B25|nr:hypothetical protein [Flavobacterium sp.]MDI1317579.1 hypothetical protein [Flavobacterium sp.]
MKLTIPNNIFYQFLFILCVSVPYLDIFELTIGTWSLTFLITIRNNYSISLFKLIIPYILILLIAFVVSFNYDYQKYFIIRDVTYLLKPVIGFFLGYQLCHKNLNNAFKLIVTTGVFIAICHIAVILSAIFIYGARTVADLRLHSGYFSDYEIYTLIILIFYKKFQLDYSKKTVRILTILVGFSAFMYLARTNFIQFLILFLALKGYFELNKKSILIFASIIITSIISYSIVLYINPRRDAEGVEGFLYKIKVAPLEPFKTKINREDYKDFNDNYRSYENIMTIRQVTRDGVTPTIFGKGLGSQIDLKQEVRLGDMNLRFISILHNGFMIVFLKSGLLGIFFYLFTIFYFFNSPKSETGIGNQITLLFIGTGVFLFISNWVFLGFYNLTETKSILLGFLIAYREKYK